jgi:hypothetical protein
MLKKVAVLCLLIVFATIPAMSQAAPRRVIVRAGKVLDKNWANRVQPGNHD